jgi:hypothetical protein
MLLLETGFFFFFQNALLFSLIFLICLFRGAAHRPHLFNYLCIFTLATVVELPSLRTTQIEPKNLFSQFIAGNKP